MTVHRAGRYAREMHFRQFRGDAAGVGRRSSIDPAESPARPTTAMGLLVVILLLEIRPMTMLIRWRVHVRRGLALDIHVAPLLTRVSYVQTGLVILMVFAATAVARGYFYQGEP